MIFICNTAFFDFIIRDQRQMKIVIANIQRENNVLYDDDDVYVKISFFNDKIVEMSIAAQNQFVIAKISRNNNRNNEKIQSIFVNKIFVNSIITFAFVGKIWTQRVVVKFVLQNSKNYIFDLNFEMNFYVN